MTALVCVASVVVSVWSIVLSWRTWSRQDAIAGRPLRWWHWRPRPRITMTVHERGPLGWWYRRRLRQQTVWLCVYALNRPEQAP